MSKKEREIYDFEMDFKKYILLLFISEYRLRNFLETRSENGCEK